MWACVVWLIDTPQCQHYIYPGHNHSLLLLLLVFSLSSADRVTGGRCLWSLLPLNGRGGLNQLSVNRFCWEVNRVEGDWTRVVRSPLLLLIPPSISISSIFLSLEIISTCPAFFITHHTITRILHFSHFLRWFSCCGQYWEGRGQTEWPMGRDGVSKHVMYPPLVQHYQPHSPRHHGNPLSDKLSET